MATERPLLSISRKSLDEGPKELRKELPAEWLARKLAPDPSRASETDGPGAADAALSASAPGSVDLRLTPSGGDNFLVQGKVAATVDTTCGRCLGPAKVPVATTMTLLMVPDAAAKARAPRGKRAKDSEGEFEFDPNEADVATYDGETLVLDDLVREAILLEVPISALCSEDCTGMPSDPAHPREKAEPLDPGKGERGMKPHPAFSKLAALRDKLPPGK